MASCKVKTQDIWNDDMDDGMNVWPNDNEINICFINYRWWKKQKVDFK